MANGSQYVKAVGMKKLYNSNKWKAIRRHQLNEQPLCVMCEQLGKLTPATVVDHIIPHRGDSVLFHAGPFQSLCKMHHDRNKQIEERSGVILGGTVDGVPIDPKHHWNAG